MGVKGHITTVRTTISTHISKVCRMSIKSPVKMFMGCSVVTPALRVRANSSDIQVSMEERKSCDHIFQFA